MNVVVPLAPAAAFALFTAEISTWWPLDTHSLLGARARRIVVEPRVGGRVFEVADDGEEALWGSVLVWRPADAFAMTWHVGRGPETAQVLEIRFRAEGGGTRVELEHRGWERLGGEAIESMQGYREGWGRIFGRLYPEAAARRAQAPGSGSRRAALALLAGLLLASPLAAAEPAPPAASPVDPERAIHLAADVPGPVAEVWKMWTTEAGIQTYLAQAARVDPRPGGAYEVYFNLAAPQGERGSEGCVVLAVDPERMLSFTWNAPPKLPAIRAQRTHVVVRLTPLAADRTRVTLVQDGWGSGAEWDQAFDYFTHAWGDFVLPRLVERFVKGPLDVGAEK
jgi:uncharacterized protein YndB with AHSA1/START domain